MLIIKSWSSILEITGAKVDVVENGLQAVDYFDANAPDLILMDIQMPEMDGAEACMVIRQSNTALPIIALTANVQPEDVERFKQIGFDDHIGKPLDMSLLYNTLSQCIFGTVT